MVNTLGANHCTDIVVTRVLGIPWSTRAGPQLQARLAEVFDKLDQDGCGHIDRLEFQLGAEQHLGISLTDAEVDSIHLFETDLFGLEQTAPPPTLRQLMRQILYSEAPVRAANLGRSEFEANIVRQLCIWQQLPGRKTFLWCTTVPSTLFIVGSTVLRLLGTSIIIQGGLSVAQLGFVILVPWTLGWFLDNGLPLERQPEYLAMLVLVIVHFPAFGGQTFLLWVVEAQNQVAILLVLVGWGFFVVMLIAFPWLGTVERAMGSEDIQSLPFLFPLQFCNDLLVELTFLNVDFGSLTFFVILVVKGGIILGRDSGVAEDLFTICMSLVQQGCAAPLAFFRSPSSKHEQYLRTQWRISEQNRISEICTSSVVLLVVWCEYLGDSLDLGCWSVTAGLNEGERTRLMAAYGCSLGLTFLCQRGATKVLEMKLRRLQDLFVQREQLQFRNHSKSGGVRSRSRGNNTASEAPKFESQNPALKFSDDTNIRSSMMDVWWSPAASSHKYWKKNFRFFAAVITFTVVTVTFRVTALRYHVRDLTTESGFCS